MFADLKRNLRHFWRSSLAIAAGAAVATSVLAGALLVGSSVRESLRQLTLERLGGVDFALAGQRFFSAESANALAKELAAEGQAAVPAILLRGTAENAASHTRETAVGIQGVDAAFFELYAQGKADDPFAAPAGGQPGLFPPVLINRGLAEALDAKVGDQVLLSLQRTSEVPAGSLLARDDTQAVALLVRAAVQGILPDEGLGSFRLDASQATPRNAFLPLQALQKALEAEGKVNAILVGSEMGARASRPHPGLGYPEAEKLNARLAKHLKLDDYGVEIVKGPSFAAVQSRELLVRPGLEEATSKTAAKLNTKTSPVLTWLVNEISFGDKRVPYSTASAVELPADPAFGHFEGPGGESLAAPAEGLWLNEWTAAELGAKICDRVGLTYFEVGPREELIEKQKEMPVAGVVALRGAALDPLFTQEYPGISGSTHMADWDPPFPIELSRIRQADEDYWDQYRATPKAFLPLATGQDWWRTRWGELSAVRIAPGNGEAVDALAARFSTALREELSPAAFGLTFLPVKSLGLQASGGATDFGGLFFGLSFFVILAAALLVSLLMNLWIEQRSGEIGLRLALGYRRQTVRRALLLEGSVLAALGALAGIFGALGYAWLMMLGLRTFWRPAVGTSRLELAASPAALLAGVALALLITIVTIAFTLRGVGKLPVPQLLRKSLPAAAGTRAGGKARWLAILGLGAGAALLLFGVLAPAQAGPFVFFLAGVLWLAGLLAAFALLMQRIRPALEAGPFAAWAIAFANSRRQYKRSLLATSLIALSTFLIVLVAAFEVDFGAAGAGEKSSGTGGFSLVAEAQVPLQYDLGSPAGRAELGLEEAAFAGVKIYPARLLPGEDTSCLNLYQPTRPRLVGLPPDLVARGGFGFKQAQENAGDPWRLLEKDLGPALVPVIGDFNSTQWILKLPLGGRLPFENERGEKIELELVASLDTSIFQSELLMSEAQLLRHFPSRGGYSYFLAETPGEPSAELVEQLERGLQRYGLDAEKTPARLAAFHAVQNTYLSTFRSLGGLGLLLGTLGLAVVLVRNVIERRGELAAMRAFGWGRGALRRLILYETLVLLFGGLAVGTIAALIGAGSQLLAHPAAAPYLAILATLAAIAAAGGLAAWLAARGALASPLLPALKTEA
jgi:putative ABC transport system permease protein